MNVSADIERLRLCRDKLSSSLIAELDAFQSQRYLATVTQTLNDARYTDLILTNCESTLSHCCAVLAALEPTVQVIATFGRISSFVPYLGQLISRYVSVNIQRLDHIARHSGEENEFLLALLRLYRHDSYTNARYVTSDLLQSYSVHALPAVRYLAMRLLALTVYAADATVQKMYARTIPDDDATALWEGIEIHYKYLTLWERKRHNAIRAALSGSRDRNAHSTVDENYHISTTHLHASVACIGGVLLPARSGHAQKYDHSAAPDIIPTATCLDNLSRLATSLKSSRPTLVAGPLGAGKTTLIRHVSRLIDNQDSMVTLHLDEQSDAKALIGLYTSGSTPGSFEWQPGVLTKAVMQGRWLLIEDIDRAPNDVLSVLLPLVERRQLVIAGQQRTLRAAPGFKIIGTLRTAETSSDQTSKLAPNILGARHWRKVFVHPVHVSELPDVINGLHTNLSELTPSLVQVYRELLAQQQDAARKSQSRTGLVRTVSLRDLLKWTARVAKVVGSRSVITEADNDQIFLDAFDCFLGSMPRSPTCDAMLSRIAQHSQIDPQSREHLVANRTVSHSVTSSAFSLGSHTFVRPRADKNQRKPIRAFSTNPHSLRLMDRIASAVVQREPLLLVGETGTGKTTVIQYLADQTGKKLHPFNLSQQSESGDLLGGFKPVNVRLTMLQLKEQFDTLFYQSFSAKVILRNQPFIDLLNKCMEAGKWLRVCKLWSKALGMVDEAQQSAAAASPTTPDAASETPAKKRKVQTAFDSALLTQWTQFSDSCNNVEKRLLAGGESSFAFAFVEGSLVKAVRNGDWVLLDEINLASPDTLESIAELLDKTPSITLSETGSIERIEAHPDFRLFAAMNPATDVGKKDLPQGIKSRFTELYVESPDQDLSSLQHIVGAFLGPTETAMTTAVSSLHVEIKQLAAQDRLIDGAGQRPYYSLRTLTRALTYATQVASQCSLRRAMAEAVQMSYTTTLDLESETQVRALVLKRLYNSVPAQARELEMPMRESRRSDQDRCVLEGRYWLRKGSMPASEQPQYIITDFVRRNLDKLARAASAGRSPVLLQGPTSSGKTSMVEYLAKRTGNVFVRINNHEHTDLQEYLGAYVSGQDGKMQFQDGILVKALREGHWIVLDELNLAPTDVLEALNRLLDDNRELMIPETQEIVRPHPDFMLFATQNPAGLYGGRKFLSRAFRNRFLELYFNDIPIDELHTILHRRTQIPESWSQRIVSVYKELSLLRQKDRVFEQKGFATLRDLFRWALRPSDTIQQLAENGYMLLAERIRDPDERQEIKKILEKVLSQKGPRVSIDETKLYSREALKLPASLTDDNMPFGIVLTNAMRRLFVLTAEAIRNNEPVLLVGDTGCGKTSVCQMLAVVYGKQLNIVNAHQNLETGDLIGAQRPTRNRSALEQELRQLLAQSCDDALIAALQSDDIKDVLKTYDESLSLSNTFSAPQRDKINSLRQRLRSLFEWVDGSLVEAMKTGQFFLLDEISLADDSVLERLNSVLESQRTILLAEKGSVDSSVTAQSGFQFMATMNPGGDYGKKELSPALRNRFTEVWVPPLTDSDDMIQVVSAKLTVSQLAPAMVDFAHWFTKRYNQASPDTISMRDLLTWVSFINKAGSDSALGVVHGCALVYVDSLGANPAAMLSLQPAQLGRERQLCIEQLSTLFEIQAQEIYYARVTSAVSTMALNIGPFTLERRTAHDEHDDASFSLVAPTTRVNAMRIARALQLTKPVLLEGNPGVGKTSLVVALAKMTRVPLTRINLSEQTDLMDLFGSDLPVEGASAGVFSWRDASFLRAMRNGEWVLLDEMNLASQSVLEGLNACLDHRGEVYVSELQQTFTRHPDFRLFAAQNPHHQGGGRKGLPASFVNRFTVVYADVFDKDDLLQICQSVYPSMNLTEISSAVEYIDKINSETTRRRLGASGSPWEFNLRDTLRWLSLSNSQHGLLAPANTPDFLDIVVTQRFRTAQDRAHAQEMYQMMDSSTTQRDLYHNISHSQLQVGLATLPRTQLAVSTHSFEVDHFDARPHLPVIESVMLSIQQNWPVILVGASGCGKSALLESLAHLTGANLVTMSLSADLDAADLVGGYEQIDNSHAAHDLYEQLQQLARLAAASLLNSSSTAASLPPASTLTLTAGEATSQKMQQLVHWLVQVESSIDGALAELTRSLVAQARALLLQPVTAERGRFGWVDGALVQAVERGHWLVLDNANLCSAASLDRLNSLLEPNGYLIINEHASSTGEPRIVRPHPHFRIFLTMDPRHGELSRALRNRAVELYMLPAPSELPLPASSPLLLHTESYLHRLNNALFLPSTSSPDACPASHDADAFAAHLSMLDIDCGSTFVAQANAGLYQCSSSQIGSACTSASYAAKLTKSYNLGSHTADELQTIHPWCNSALSRIISASPDLVYKHGALFDIAVDVACMHTALADVKAVPQSATGMTRLQRSAHRDKIPNVRQLSTAGVFASLQGILTAIESSVQRYAQSQVDDRQNSKLVICAIRGLQRLWWTLYNFTNSNDRFDEAAFATYREIIEDWATKNTVPSAQQTSLPANSGSFALARATELESMYKDVGPAIKTLGSASRTKNAASMTLLWSHLKPEPIADLQALESILALEQLADRFDAMAWTFSAGTEYLAGLRIRFQEALKASRSSSTSSDLVEVLSTTISPNPTEEAEPSIPHFADTFEVICQLLDMCEITGSAFPRASSNAAQRNLANMLALRPTRIVDVSASASESSNADAAFLCEDVGLKQISHAIRSIAGDLACSHANLALTHDFNIRILSQLRSLHKVPMARLDLLQEESVALGRLIAADAHRLCLPTAPILHDILHEVIKGMLSIFVDVSETRDVCQTLLGRLNGESAATEVAVGHAEDADIAGLLETYISPCVEHVRTTLEDARSFSGSTHAAAIWISLALGCLQIYLPSGIYDPALKPVIEHDMACKHHEQLNAKLAMWQQFQVRLTGRPYSYAIQDIINQMSEIGHTPGLVNIVRPLKSSLDQLQGVFDALARTLRPLCTLSFEQRCDLVQDPVFAANIAQLETRLRNDFRVYEDLVTPALMFLDYLKIGIALAQSARKSYGSSAGVNNAIVKATPLLAATPDACLDGSTYNVSASLSLETQLHLIESFTFISGLTTEKESSAAIWQQIHTALDNAYGSWKSELTSDQKANATKSSLYKYRGGDDLEDEVDDEDYQELFPDYSSESEVVPDKTQMPINTFAPRLTVSIARLMSCQDPMPLNTLMQSAGQVMELDPDARPVAANDGHSCLPLIFDQLQTAKDRLSGDNAATSMYNIYSDSNMPQVRKLMGIVKQTERRFKHIQTIWPDNATLVDVLRACNDLTQLGHLEPLAKILIKLEKLHEHVYEWQRVTDSEHSAASVYDSITDLIISWRQLELSTWSRLLDLETLRCNEEARSWWFVAYENVIAVPLQMISEDKDLQEHISGLLKTLSDFFLNTGLGQFNQRLQLVMSLQRYSKKRAQSQPALSKVSDALSNFVRYMRRFESRILEKLNKGRASLAKEIKDVIQLASWKDRNIIALRQSAKASHRKLFKYVRRYRKLLGEPAASIIVACGEFDPALITAVQDDITASISADAARRHVEVCEGHVAGWNDLSSRFKNIDTTVRVMSDLTKQPSETFDVAQETEAWLQDILASAELLRKETPSTLDDDTKSVVQHLKTRKRRLYADVLKELRGMGYKANLGSDALAKQDSIEAVLTDLAPLSNALHHSEKALSAEQYLHLILHFMPRIRRANREHSEDLTSAEVLRSVGLLEGMLQCAIQQRQTVQSAQGAHAALKSTLSSIATLQCSIAVKSARNTSSPYTLIDCMGMLPAILETTVSILRQQANLGDFELDVQVATLLEDAAMLRNLYEQRTKQITVVAGLITEEQELIDDTAVTQMDGIRAKLNMIISAHPVLGPVIKQVIIWASPTTSAEQRGSNIARVADHQPDYLAQTTSLVDNILGAMQDVNKAISGLPTSNEAHGWHMQEQEALSNALSLARVAAINDGLMGLLSQLPTIADQGEEILDRAVAVISTFAPIFTQFERTTADLINRLAAMHCCTTKMAFSFARLFSSLAETGFCKPSEKASGKQDKSDKLEDGTGLGDGEGAEDISKDIGDDEDMTELAQEPNETERQDEIEDEQDAVDMADAEMEGQMMDDEKDKDEENQEKENSDNEEQDVDEEVGDVDDLGPSAVDEKMWDDGGRDEDQRDKEGDKAAGTEDKDEQTAGKDDQEHQKDKPDVNDDAAEEEEQEAGVDETEKIDQGETEAADPHMSEQQNLDLPEDINMDDQDDGADGPHDDEDMKDMDDDMTNDEAHDDEQDEEDVTKEELDGDARSSYSATPEIPEVEEPESTEAAQDDDNDEHKTQDVNEDTEEEPKVDEDVLQDRRQDESIAADQVDPSDAQGTGISEEQAIPDKQDQAQQASAEEQQGNEGEASEMQQQAGAQGKRGAAKKEQHVPAEDQNDREADDEATQPFKKLGDALEDWYKKRQQVADAREADIEQKRDADVDTDMADAEFEHLPDDGADADGQALGAATEEQATAINEDDGIDVNEETTHEHFPPEETMDEDVQRNANEKSVDEEAMEDMQRQAEPSDHQTSAFVGDYRDADVEMRIDPEQAKEEDDILDIDSQIQDVQLTNGGESDQDEEISSEIARRTWLQHESATHTLSLTLTEHLRLILSPTTATRLRGDFRTGKRLNMKRIIPYIASQYKRDKIWMRRSVPSKRAYQIMLAIDDSKSMGENPTTASLAFETLALVSRSLSMLEAGDLCVVRFGTQVDVVHQFGTPFTTESGAEVVRRFGFEQGQTDVQKLLVQSLDMFSVARTQATSSAADLWQLQFIISDGVCRDHASLRRLVRKATEARIMIVFVIIDPAALSASAHENSGATDGGSSNDKAQKESGPGSILDLQTASFTKDQDGNPKVETVRYLETFPFRYYLIVRAVQELPSVLAGALRQWFAEVVDSGA